MIRLAQNETGIDVPAYFHAILFAYQTRLKEILGSGEAIFVHPVLATISRIDAEKGLSTIRGNSLAEILDNFAKDLTASKMVEKACLSKMVQRTLRSTLMGVFLQSTLMMCLSPRM